MRFTVTLFQKGQLVKQGMQGKKIKPQKARNQYAKLSYGTAHKTAGRLDEALKAVSLFNSN
jgi:hypothetical protein